MNISATEKSVEPNKSVVLKRASKEKAYRLKTAINGYSETNFTPLDLFLDVSLTDVFDTKSGTVVETSFSYRGACETAKGLEAPPIMYDDEPQVV